MSRMRKLGLGGLAVALSLGTAVTVADASGHDMHTRAANHGAAVSAVARSESTTGEAHGDAVSAVAKKAPTDNDVDKDNDAANGSRISVLATTTTARGAAKGEVISDAASAHGAKMSGRIK